MEEQALVRFLKNKSCSVQGATRAEAAKYIHDMFEAIWISNAKEVWDIS